MPKVQIHSSVSITTEQMIETLRRVQETETSFSQMTEALILKGIKASGYKLMPGTGGNFKAVKQK